MKIHIKNEKLWGKIFCIAGIWLIVMMIYLLFVPPYTHKFVVEDVYNAFYHAGSSSVHDKWATRANITLWDYLFVSSDDQMLFNLAHQINNAVLDSDFNDHTYENMMLRRSLLIINSIWGFLFLGAGLFLTQLRSKKVDTQNNKFNDKDDIIGLLGFIFSLIALSFCWISIIGLIVWSIGFIFSLWGVFTTPRIISVVGIIISLVDIVLIMILANQLPAMF